MNFDYNGLLEFYYFLNIPYKNDELKIIILLIFLMIILIFIIYWDTIYSQILLKSTCRNELNPNFDSKYILKVYDNYNNKLFNVIYDMFNRETKILCTCTSGSVFNKFKNIYVRNLKNKTDNYNDKVCECDKNYDIESDKDLIYKGDSELIRYMKNKSDYFFSRNNM